MFHWLKRIAEAKGLDKSHLWKRKQSYLTAVVTGRYLARISGQKPASIEEVLDELSSFRLGAPGKTAITEILKAVDEAARRKNEHGTSE